MGGRCQLQAEGNITLKNGANKIGVLRHGRKRQWLGASMILRKLTYRSDAKAEYLESNGCKFFTAVFSRRGETLFVFAKPDIAIRIYSRLKALLAIVLGISAVVGHV